MNNINLINKFNNFNLLLDNPNKFSKKMITKINNMKNLLSNENLRNELQLKLNNNFNIDNFYNKILKGGDITDDTCINEKCTLENYNKEGLPFNHDQPECAICFEVYNHQPLPSVPLSNDLAILKPCNHIFHMSCIGMWIGKSNKLICPLCKNEFKCLKTNNICIMDTNNISEFIEKINPLIQESIEQDILEQQQLKNNKLDKLYITWRKKKIESEAMMNRDIDKSKEHREFNESQLKRVDELKFKLNYVFKNITQILTDLQLPENQILDSNELKNRIKNSLIKSKSLLEKFKTTNTSWEDNIKNTQINNHKWTDYFNQTQKILEDKLRLIS